MKPYNKDQIITLLARVSCGEFHDIKDCKIVDDCDITHVQLSLQLDVCDSKDGAIHAIIHFLVAALRASRTETIKEIEIADLERLNKL